MVVLQVTPTLQVGGVERTTIDMAEAITRAGGRALVASRGGQMEAELARVGGELIRLPMDSKNPLEVFLNIGRLAGLSRRRGVGLIHARSRAPAWSALAAARRLGVPFVTTYHGVYNGHTGLKRFYNSVMARGDLVIANSEFTRRHVLEQHGVDPERVITIPRGVDLAKFDPEALNPADVAAMRARWGLGPEDRRLAVVLPARLTRWKGHEVMVQAAAALERRAPGAFLTIMAGGAYGRQGFKESLEGDIRDAGLGAHVRLIGHQDDMPLVLAAADIVVCPSIEPEAFGRTAVEGQAMGRPVVASRLGGLAETVINGETGVSVEANDPEALAEALLGLLRAGPQARAALGGAAKARMRQRYSKAALQAATLGVYDRLMSDQSWAAETRAERL